MLKAWQPRGETWRPRGSPLLYHASCMFSVYGSGDPWRSPCFTTIPHLQLLRPDVHGIFAAQHLLIELADAGLGDGLHKLDPVGQPPFRNARAQVLEDFI